ncbi:MAG: hypothetical protein ACRDPA_31580 [Solirubrobacteraceae bacterium]
MLDAVGDPVGEVAIGARVRARPDITGAEVRVGARDVLLVPALEREREAALELLDPTRQPSGHLGGADVVQRMHEDLGLPEALGESDCELAALDRLADVAGEHRQLRRVAVCHRELAAGWLGLEQLDGATALANGGSAVRGEPGQPRQPPAVVPLADPVATLLMERQRRLARLEGRVELLGQIALVRPALPQLGPALRRQRRAVPERPRELIGGLAMDAQPGGALAGRRRVTEHGLDVAGRVGVVGQARRVDRAVGRRRQRQQHLAV